MPDRTPINCRLCGSDAKIRHVCCGAENRRAYVECRACRCRGPAILFVESAIGKRPHVVAERKAVEGWNRLHARVDEPPARHESEQRR